MPPGQSYTWLINLLPVPCVPAAMVVNVFWLSYLQYVAEFRIDEAVQNTRRDEEIHIEDLACSGCIGDTEKQK